jgi:hypothetical protein
LVMGRDLNLEDAEVLVFEGKVMTRLGRDFDLLRFLRGQSKSGDEEGGQQQAFHETRF